MTTHSIIRNLVVLEVVILIMTVHLDDFITVIELRYSLNFTIYMVCMFYCFFRTICIFCTSKSLSHGKEGSLFFQQVLYLLSLVILKLPFFVYDFYYSFSLFKSMDVDENERSSLIYDL